MARKPKFTVRRRRSSWIVEVSATVSKTGKRERLSFRTRREADASAVRFREEHFKFGVEAHKLPHDLQIDAVKAAEILAPHGVTLAHAARQFADRQVVRSGSIEFGELFRLYLGERELAEATFRDYRQVGNRLAPHLGGRMICDIDANDIREAFTSVGLTPHRRNAFKKMLSSVWNFAIKRGLDTRNPLRDVEVAKVKKGETKILGPDQVGRLMAAAQRYDGGLMLPYFALAIFAGIRPAELRRLSWEDIDLAKGHIYISARNSKTGADRYVDIEPALAAWLAACPDRAGRVCDLDKRDYNERFDAIREAAGVKEGWPADVMRHSYCSYWIGFHSDQHRLVEMAGHSIRVNMKHYRRATTREDAVAFWSIVPAGHARPVLANEG